MTRFRAIMTLAALAFAAAPAVAQQLPDPQPRSGVGTPPQAAPSDTMQSPGQPPAGPPPHDGTTHATTHHRHRARHHATHPEGTTTTPPPPASGATGSPQG